MSQEQENQTNENSEVQKINAIRDIIFGSDMQEYDHKFNALKDELTASNKEIKTFIEELKKEFDSKITALEELLDAKVNQLESTMKDEFSSVDHKKMDRERLGTLLEQIGKEIKAKP